MVVEHEFITTLEPGDALGRLAQFFGERGFAPCHASGRPAFPVEAAAGSANAWSTLEFRRGRKTPRRVKHVGDLPQKLRVEYDRGRVQVAVLLEPYPRAREHDTAYGLGLAQIPQLVLSDPPRAASDWSELERFSNARYAKVRRRYLVVCWLILAFLAVCIAGVILAGIYFS